MKKSFLLVSLSTVGFALPLAAQSDSSLRENGSPAEIDSSGFMGVDLSDSARVISEETLERRLTAEDLLGATVVGSDNATLGEIVDVTLSDSQLATPDPEGEISTSARSLDDHREERYGVDEANSEIATNAPASEDSPAKVEDFHGNDGEHRTASKADSSSFQAPRLAVVIKAESGIFEEATLIEVPIDALRRNLQGKLSLDLSLDEFNGLAKRDRADEAGTRGRSS